MWGSKIPFELSYTLFLDFDRLYVFTLRLLPGRYSSSNMRKSSPFLWLLATNLDVIKPSIYVYMNMDSIFLWIIREYYGRCFAVTFSSISKIDHRY